MLYTFAQAIPLVKAHLLANVPVMLWGSPGIGKSDVVRQIARELSWSCLDNWRASTMDPTDIKGVPNVVNGRTVFNPPGDLPDVARDGEEGIVFLDEINTGPALVQAGMMQFTLDRRIGNYSLPPKWRIAAAGNLISDKAAAQRMISSLGNRMAHFYVQPDFQVWKAWAVQNGVMPEIVAFLEWKESKGQSLLHKMPQRDEVRFPTPRSWARTSTVCQHAPTMAFQIAEANVGEAAAVEFKGFLDVYRSLPKLAEIEAAPDTCRIPLEGSAQFAVCAMLSRAASASNLAAIVRYVKRIGADYSVMTVTDAVRRDVNLKQAPGYADWAVANQHVMV
jgi:hypothetical protein